MNNTNDPRFAPAVDMLRRTGMQEFRIGYTPEEDGEPVVWYATGLWKLNELVHHEAAAAMDPLQALFRLCETVIDGGRCVHCNQPTAFTPEHTDTALLELMACVYAFDPELNTFRRTCEGGTDEDQA